MVTIAKVNQSTQHMYVFQTRNTGTEKKVMALSLLQGYSSPSEASESDSDDSDDGIVVTIDRNVLNGGRPGRNRIFLPLLQFAHFQQSV